MSDQDVSLGGSITTIEITTSTINNLFDDVSSSESLSGDTEYRCVYLKNANSLSTMLGTKVWIQTNTPNAGSSIEIGLGTSAVNGVEQVCENESTAPTGVIFSTAIDVSNALNVGDIPPAQHKAIWIKRIINANSSAYTNDSAVIRIQCESSA